MTYAGELASLSAAALWALAVTMFRDPIAAHGARTVNLAKCLLAAVLQGLTVLAVGQLGPLRAAPSDALLAIAASGVIGLVVGDTALFAAVARIGVHRTLLLQTLGPVFAATLAMLWLGERIGASQVLGALTILAGVALVVALAGIAWAPASIAAVLLATSPVFSLVLESVGERRLPDARGSAGTLLAVAGVAVLSW